MKAIELELWIKAPSETVFWALTKREGLDAWWGRALSAAHEVGSLVEFDHGLESPLQMEVTELAPNRRLAWKCISDFDDPHNPAAEWLGHELAFDLRPASGDEASAWMGPRLGFDPKAADAVTILEFRHSGWSPDSRWYAFCNAGWGTTLAGLAQLCEGRP